MHQKEKVQKLKTSCAQYFPTLVHPEQSKESNKGLEFPQELEPIQCSKVSVQEKNADKRKPEKQTAFVFYDIVPP